MSSLRREITFETAFAQYTAKELLGEGGAGRVYGGIGPDNEPIAIKVLKSEQASSEKRSRFKNEIAFLSRNKHANLVPVLDHGVSRDKDIGGPFFVMPRYDGSLRAQIVAGLVPTEVLPLFSQILDGVEAAHLQLVTHCDLKPENILYRRVDKTLAIADFGIAHFNADLMATIVETHPSTRLANFLYAAPEQRNLGQPAREAADVYALGLMLNEMFTGSVPQGTNYRLIQSVDQQFGFLDPLVSRMLAQSPAERPASIGEIKGEIQRYQLEAVSLQRLSNFGDSVVRIGEVDEPLALEPPRLISFDWNAGKLTLTLDRPVSPEWILALQNMNYHQAVLGKSPERFKFNRTLAYLTSTPRSMRCNR